jgi:hypothetical protein
MGAEKGFEALRAPRANAEGLHGGGHGIGELIANP